MINMAGPKIIHRTLLERIDAGPACSTCTKSGECPAYAMVRVQEGIAEAASHLVEEEKNKVLDKLDTDKPVGQTSEKSAERLDLFVDDMHHCPGGEKGVKAFQIPSTLPTPRSATNPRIAADNRFVVEANQQVIGGLLDRAIAQSA